jgi:hypothetical protein
MWHIMIGEKEDAKSVFLLRKASKSGLIWSLISF